MATKERQADVRAERAARAAQAAPVVTVEQVRQDVEAARQGNVELLSYVVRRFSKPKNGTVLMWGTIGPRSSGDRSAEDLGDGVWRAWWRVFDLEIWLRRNDRRVR